MAQGEKLNFSVRGKTQRKLENLNFNFLAVFTTIQRASSTEKIGFEKKAFFRAIINEKEIMVQGVFVGGKIKQIMAYG